MDELSGVLIINKGAGMTSHDVVGRVRRIYNTKRVGHTGTLDPMAAGVLCVLVGRAAKAAEYLGADTKRYRATLRLGITTDTEDTTGKILTECGDIPCEERVREAVSGFVGDIMQIPPMYSALKVGGKKLCDLARRGEIIEREARPITVFSLECERIDERNYTLDIHASSGTYVRTLCADIGAALGCGGAMASLERSACGNFKIEDALTLDELSELDETAKADKLLPVESLFSDLPQVLLPEFFSRLASSGCEIYQKKIGCAYPVGTRVRMYNKDGFFALGEVRDYENGTAIKVIKLFVI